MKHCILIILFLLGLFSLGKAEDFSFEADLIIEKEISMHELKSLNFGDVKILSNNQTKDKNQQFSTIRLPVNGIFNNTEEFSIAQETMSNGIVEISGTPNTTISGLNIIVTAPLIGENGDTLSADLFHSNILPLKLDANGKATVKIGGELLFDASTVKGKYSGKYKILLDY